jgi:hypothetical protein
MSLKSTRTTYLSLCFSFVITSCLSPNGLKSLKTLEAIQRYEAIGLESNHHELEIDGYIFLFMLGAKGGHLL